MAVYANSHRLLSFYYFLFLEIRYRTEWYLFIKLYALPAFKNITNMENISFRRRLNFIYFRSYQFNDVVTYSKMHIRNNMKENNAIFRAVVKLHIFLKTHS